MDYISLSGQKKYHTECKSLSLCFDLLKNDYSKRLEKYLASPYFIEDNPYLLPLFKTLYSRYLRNSKTVQGSRIINDVYDGDEKKTLARIRTDILLIEQNIYRFLGYQYMQQNPEEEQRLITLSLHNINQPKAFESSLKEWKKTTNKLPHGLAYHLNCWLYHHFEYYSLDTPKTIKAHPLFLEMRASLNQLLGLLDVLYDHEVLSWQKVFRQNDEMVSTSESDDHFLETIYRQLLDLRQQDNFDEKKYQQITSFLKEKSDRTEPLHHLLIWQLSMNYIIDINRSHGQNHNKDLFFLVKHYMEKRLYSFFAIASREVMLNNVKIALMNNDPDLAEHIVDAMNPKLPLEDQKLSKAHVNISIAFHKKEDEKTINLLHEHFPKHTMDAYHDGLRLKSYRLRSALRLLAYKQDYYDEYVQAFDDFEKFLSRKKEKLGQDQYRYYQPFLRYIGIFFRSLSDDNAEQKLIDLNKELVAHPSAHAQIWMEGLINELLA
ncbi:MAG: hypothetical protein MI974_14145 [Chitinophagales bacterium]|nr:hypothetical protein [Chitinophagales bacterium]